MTDPVLDQVTVLVRGSDDDVHVRGCALVSPPAIPWVWAETASLHRIITSGLRLCTICHPRAAVERARGIT